jgi:hypothetical protein
VGSLRTTIGWRVSMPQQDRKDFGVLGQPKIGARPSVLGCLRATKSAPGLGRGREVYCETLRKNPARTPRSNPQLVRGTRRALGGGWLLLGRVRGTAPDWVCRANPESTIFGCCLPALRRGIAGSAWKPLATQVDPHSVGLGAMQWVPMGHHVRNALQRAIFAISNCLRFSAIRTHNRVERTRRSIPD